VVQEFYLKLRHEHHNSESTPVTPRQLESLIRLSEARARVELRETVTAEDALDVVDIMRESLYDLFSDEFGHVDFTRAGGLSKSKQVSVFMKALHRKAESKQSSTFNIKELYKIAQDIHLGVENFEQFVDNLNQQNFLLAKGGRKYQVQGSEFT